MIADLPPMPPESAYIEICQSEAGRIIDYAKNFYTDKDEKKATDEKANAAKDGPFAGMREKAVSEEALSYGAQYGLYYRSKQIDNLLYDQAVASNLDAIANFRSLMTEGDIMPPVISESTGSMAIGENLQSARSAATTWEIIQPAYIASATPTWRDYLSMSYAPPELVSIGSGVLPKDEAERSVWKSNLCKGMANGWRQADILFQDKTNLMLRNINGMIKFRTLAIQGIVTMPTVEEGRLGITVNGNKVHVDEKVRQITLPSQFNQTTNWKSRPTAR